MTDRAHAHNGVSEISAQAIGFGPFTLDAQRRELLRNGEPVALERKAFDLLAFLADHPDIVVSKDDLWKHIWDSRDISESVIPQAVGKARKALAEHSEWIATVHGVGYRFTAPVTTEREPETSSLPLRRTHWIAWSAAVTALAIILSTVLLIDWSPPLATNRIAVLPFANLSSNPELDFFGDGMADELLHELAAFEELHVASRMSSFRFRSAPNVSEPDLHEIGAKLGVRYVVDGSVRLADDQFRMTVRLSDTETGYQVWSSSFEGPWTDILTTQKAITRAVIEQIRPQLLPQYAQSPGSAKDSRAYELYLRGRHLWHKRTPEAVNEAIALFRQAADQQPDFAMAYTGLAESYLTLAVYGDLEPQFAYDKAQALLDHAITLAPDLAETRMALGNLHALRTQWRPAQSELLTALALNPSLAMAHMSLGNVYNELGQIVDAYERFRSAMNLDPLHPTIALNLAQASLKLGLAQRAEEYLNRAQSLAPDHTFLFGFRAVVYISDGDKAAAGRLLEEWQAQPASLAHSNTPDSRNRAIACGMLSVFLDRARVAADCLGELLETTTADALGPQYHLLALTHLAWAKEQLGEADQAFDLRQRAAHAAERARELQPNSEILAYEEAVALSSLGYQDRAVEVLGESVAMGRRDVGLMANDRRLDGLRGHRAFEALIQRLQKEQATMRQQVLTRYPEAGIVDVRHFGSPLY